MSLSIYVAAFFSFLATIYLTLSFSRGSAPARKTWRRIGVIFALVALVLFVVGSR